MLAEHLILMPVVTESGRRLGTVCDAVWDAENFIIIQLKVKRNFFDRAPLLIHTSYIVQVHVDRIVVEDALNVSHLRGETLQKVKKLAALGKSGQPAPAQRSSDPL